MWISVSSLLRGFESLFSAVFREESLIPWKREPRHQQTGGGESEENLPPDPEITGCGS